MTTRRRTFVQQSLALGVASSLPSLAKAQTTVADTSLPIDAGLPVPEFSTAAVPTPLAGATHPKFVLPMPNPLAATNVFKPDVTGGSAYTLRIRQFAANLGLVGPTGLPLRTVMWGYAAAGQATTAPGRTFVVRQNKPIQVTYKNQLVNSVGVPIAHRLKVDTTLMWANPGNLGGQAPVPLVAHRHGGLQDTASDGLPEAWATPDANADGIPDFRGRLYSTPYTFTNAQEAGHLWYHDHALGVTRLNVAMGLAGNYIIRDTNEDYLVANRMIPSGAYEVLMTLRDQMFDTTGKVFYPYIDAANPGAPVPTHLPEFFGDFILVNGVPWPRFDVEPRPYRLRIVNASDSRFYDLTLGLPNGAALPIRQIGTELGMMNAPVTLTHLLIAPGERADVVVDFTGWTNANVNVVNSANGPFPNGNPVDPLADGQVMRFRVVKPLNTAVRKPVLPAFLRPVNGLLPAVSTAGVPVRKLMLLEGIDSFGRLETLLGTVNPAAGNPATPAHGTFFYSDPVTENIAVGATEIWELHNTTVDAHPVHLHLVDFRVLNRQPFTGTIVDKPMGPNGTTTGGYLTQIAMAGAARPAEPGEAGRKDTVITYPGEVTRILVKFPRAGEYVWHCHILSHEDHEMMRRFIVR
ncbi:multicopper oxidase family protein [Ideonella sp. A 288]|uniref:multicopper oxidase family protein n=1 Tax=Ideonella sp. A 288 TaxID=1962181 RepID=UPI000B4A6C8A|nr:multicopper oxidase domain-containing protein [Ideonella sp. A 288]